LSDRAAFFTRRTAHPIARPCTGACVDSSGQCEVERICSVRGRWNPVNDAIQQALSAITLADMRGAAQPWPYRAAAPAPLPAAE
jgi:DNA-binding IscR family transcriptional regulator